MGTNKIIFSTIINIIYVSIHILLKKFMFCAFNIRYEVVEIQLVYKTLDSDDKQNLYRPLSLFFQSFSDNFATIIENNR